MTIDEDVQLPVYVIATKPIDTWEHASKYVPFFISDNVRIFKMSEQKIGMFSDEHHAGIDFSPKK